MKHKSLLIIVMLLISIYSHAQQGLVDGITKLGSIYLDAKVDMSDPDQLNFRQMPKNDRVIQYYSHQEIGVGLCLVEADLIYAALSPQDRIVGIKLMFDYEKDLSTVVSAFKDKYSNVNPTMERAYTEYYWSGTKKYLKVRLSINKYLPHLIEIGYLNKLR